MIARLEMEDSFSTRSCLLEQEIKGQRLCNVAHFLSCHLQSSRQDTSLPAQNVYTSAGIAIALASYGSMWISNENTTCTEC